MLIVALVTTESNAGLEVAKSYALVTLGCVVAVVGAARLGFDAYAPLAVAAILFVSATRGVERMPGGVERAGISLGGLLDAESDDRDAGPLGLVGLVRTIARGVVPSLRELGVAVALSALIFPPFYFGYVWYWRLDGVIELRAPLELASLALTQVVLVAVPEEAYFRGYLQTRLGDVWARTVRVAGITVAPAPLVVQALGFGLLHFVVDPNPARLAVALPALLFGLLRAARGGIGAAVFFHVLCNLYSETLALSVR